MSEQTTSQWRVKVNGGTQVGVRPGESLEIGRKPLRPLPDDGVARLEIEDSAKSMSKRHALLTVNADGDALLRDLNSTNGSYVVNPDGQLMRLPAGADFPLPTSPIRLQFGDVPIDFVRVDQPDPAAKPAAPHVANLFDYSSPTTSRQEPDPADMSVADILDLRAGEPTAVFSAQQSAAGQAASVKPLDPVKALAGTGPSPDASDDDEPESDFHVDVSLDASDTSGASDASALDQPISASDAAGASASGTVIDAVSDTASDEPAHAHPADSMPLRLDDAHADAAPRDLFVDAATGSIPAVAVTTDADVYPAVADRQQPAAAQPSSADDQSPVIQGTPDNTQPMENHAPDATPDATPATVVTESVVDQTVVAANASDTPHFEPEPGSVFEKVSNGDFDREPRIIEAGGYTSEDARHTTDMTQQFEMARHRELLPFLAMNPALYDDLYAWLAAQGNHDIDEALAHNAGYQDYREAVGK